MKDLKVINSYEIYKCGTWCEVTKCGEDVFWGSVDEEATHIDIYNALVSEAEKMDLMLSLENLTFSEIEEVIDRHIILSNVFNHGDVVSQTGGTEAAEERSYFYQVFYDGMTFLVDESITRKNGKDFYNSFQVYKLK